MSTAKMFYNEEDKEASLADIKEKNTSIRKAAFKYGIPFSTLIGTTTMQVLRDQAHQPYSCSKQSQLWCMRLRSL